jgi:DHA2 family multidrug resistance protein
MRKLTPVFKPWVPEWFIRATIFIVVLPCLLLFGLSVANANAAVGYYGIEPADAQYSMIVFYAAVASYFALERRFFLFLPAKAYFITGTIIQLLSIYVCYSTRNLYVLFIFRFIQGMANCGTTSICITLIFSRLQSERAREIGYSIFYGMLLCSTPLSLLLTAHLIDSYNYNLLYKAIIFFYIPGAVCLFCIMNTVRLHKKIPLYQIDWASFVISATFLCLLGYIFIYGQQYYWFQDQRIVRSTVALLVLLAIYIFRQSRLKRPAHDFNILKYRNYVVGIFLVFVLYIARGSLNMTTSYFASALGMDPIHIAYVMLANIVGIIIGGLISSRMLIQHRKMRLILIYGFCLLLIFHVLMVFLFSTQADASSFIIPLICQGFGAGMLMAPLIVFTVSSVPAIMASTASGIGVLVRFLGFCSSIAMINFYQLYNKTNHINRFQERLTSLNPVAVERLSMYKKMFIAKGVPADQATKMANGLLSRTLDLQAQLRSAVDYYKMISSLLVVVILIIALIPYISRTIINLKSRQPAPASY